MTSGGENHLKIAGQRQRALNSFLSMYKRALVTNMDVTLVARPEPRMPLVLTRTALRVTFMIIPKKATFSGMRTSPAPWKAKLIT